MMVSIFFIIYVATFLGAGIGLVASLIYYFRTRMREKKGLEADGETKRHKALRMMLLTGILFALLLTIFITFSILISIAISHM
ncbi:MAG: hypothetical protein J5898_02040 [Lachnospiraceae bacterium]|nr:hypothetical protein [Lachnospiraceae bacterium]